MIDESIRKTVVVANVIATLLIVSIHYSSHRVVFINDIDFNYFFQEFLANGLARVAVPVFAIISGVFYCKSWENRISNFNLVKKKFKSLLVPYCLASLFFSLITLLTTDYNNEKFEIDFLYNSFTELIFHPLSAQLWYLRDLLILVVIVPFISFSKKTVQLYFVSILFVIWLFDIQPFPVFYGWFFLNIETVFFFILGWVLWGHFDLVTKLFNMTDIVFYWFLAGWFALIAVRGLLAPTLVVWYVGNYTISSLLLYKASIIIGIIPFVIASHRLRRCKLLLSLSSYSFFIYLYHLFPVSYIVKKLGVSVMGEKYSFYFTFPFAIIFVVCVGAVLVSISPTLFSILIGGRSIPAKNNSTNISSISKN